MRPLLALCAALLCLGSVAAYTRFLEGLAAERTDDPPVIVETRAAGRYALEITLTFDAAADAFELEPTSVLVQFRGEDVLRTAERVAAGAPLRVEDVPGVVEGRNEFFVKIMPDDVAAPLSRAVRVRVLRDGTPLAEQSLWSEPGAPVEGVVKLEVPAAAAASHGH